MDMNNVPSIDMMKRLLMRSANVSDRRVVFHLLEQQPPMSWRRTALLRNHRAVFLDAEGRSEGIGGYSITLDSEAGVSGDVHVGQRQDRPGLGDGAQDPGRANPDGSVAASPEVSSAVAAILALRVISRTDCITSSLWSRVPVV